MRRDAGRLQIWRRGCEDCRSAPWCPALFSDASRQHRLLWRRSPTSWCRRMSGSANVVTAHGRAAIAEMQARALQCVREIDARVGAEFGSQSLWVLVSHGDVIKSILADAAGAHLDHFQRFVVGPASLSVVSYTARRPFVVRLNDNGAALAALVPPPAEALVDDGTAVVAQDGGAPSGDAPVGGGGSSDTVSTN